MVQESEDIDDQPQFDQWQYDFLKRCSEKGEEGIKDWNKWRKEHPKEDICLNEQDLSGRYLCGINLMRGRTGDAFFTRAQNITDYSGQVYLRKVDFRGAHVEGGWLAGAHLEGSKWESAKAQNADFHRAKLRGAHLSLSFLDGCSFDEAVLAQAQLTATSIRGAKFIKTDMRGCTARAAIVDGATEIWECKVNAMVDFTGVGLGSIIIDPATKQLLEYNVGRMNWERWYRAGKPDYALRLNETVREREVRKAQEARRCILTSPVHLFWFVSDYGQSTGRIVATFFILALVFAALYYIAAIASPPGAVNSLLEGKEGVVPGRLVPFRALYFSVVTMTTLGFGDMHANCQSFWGHVLLTLQVLLGYALLGALVTRFAVLFTAGGPAGRFADAKPNSEHQDVR